MKIIDSDNGDTDQFGITRAAGFIGFLFPEPVLPVNTLAIYVIEYKETNCF